MPVEALGHPRLCEWLRSSDHLKLAHNMNVDCHAIENTANYEVAGVQDTLALARWQWPERVGSGGGYDLKSLARDILGLKPSGAFDDLFSKPRVVDRSRVIRTSSCDCGVLGCRKRSLGHIRTRLETIENYSVTLKSRVMIPLSEIVPGHEKWDTLVKYSGEDAEWALELWDLIQSHPAKRAMPW